MQAQLHHTSTSQDHLLGFGLVATEQNVAAELITETLTGQDRWAFVD